MNMKGARTLNWFPLTLVVLAAVLLSSCGGEPELNSISVSPEQETVTIGQTLEFTAEALSKEGENMPETAIQWSLDPSDIGSIDTSGVFSAQKPGQATVKASSDTVSGTATVDIRPKKVETIKVRTEKEQALPLSRIKVQGKLLAGDNTPAGFNTVSLSPETKGLELSADSMKTGEEGEFAFELVLGPEPGPNTVLLKSGPAEDTLSIAGSKIVKLAIQPERDTFEVNELVDFQALGFDKFGNHRPVKTKWTVSGDKAEVKKDGKVRMLSTGEAVIVADFHKLSRGRPFSIVPGELAEIHLHPEELSLQAGQSRYLKVTGKNSHGHSLPVDVSWSLSENLGSIDPDGLFVAKKAGTGEIKASQDDISASIPVTVEPGFLSDIELKLEKTSLQAGETTDLKAQGYDVFGNPIPVEPIWSLDQALGRIDQQRDELTVYQSGQGSVRAQKDNILKAVQIKVAPADLYRLEIIPSNPTVTAGNEIRFQIKGFDRFNNQVAADPQLELRDKLGDLTADGSFKALQAGNTVLNVQQEEVKASTSVAVVPGEMVKAVLTPDAPVVLQAGEVQNFKVFGLDALGNTVYSKTVWNLQPPALGTVDNQGVLTGKKTGKGKIVAEIQDQKSGETAVLANPVQIKPGEPVKIDIAPEQASLAAGEKRAFQATVYDKFGNTVNTAVNWSLKSESIGSVSKNGIFKPVKSGEWKITAGVKNVRAHAEVSVAPDEIAYNNVTPAQLSLKAGETQKMEAVSEDRFGNVVASDVVWKVVPSELGHVTKDNVFVAQKTGQGYLTAVANDIAQKLPLEVQKGPLDRINIELPEVPVPSGSSLKLQAKGFDPGNNPVAMQPNWSLEPETLGRIDEQGQFTAVKAGKGRIIAASKGVEASAELEVVPGEASRITVLNSTPIEITAGESIELNIQAFDAQDNRIPKPEFTFQIEDKLGTVLKDSQFRAHLAGSGDITVSAGQARTAIPVRVAVGPVARIEVQPAETAIASGSNLTFQASGYDQEGNQVNLKPSWTVIGGIGSITEEGKFTAHTVGQGFVSCQMSGVAGLSRIQVEPGSVSRIEVQPEHLEIAAGQNQEFTGAAFDAQGNVVPVELHWSVQGEDSPGSISKDGIFSATSAGSAQIQAEHENIQGQAQVTVVPGELSELILEKQDLKLASGEQIKLQAKSKDQYGNAVQASVSWTVSPESLATVSSSGLVTARKAGSGTLRATKGSLTAAVDLTVVPGPLASIRIQAPNGLLKGGQSYQFKAQGFDSGGNRVHCSPNWAVTTHIGNIDRTSGKFKANKVGSGSVEAYDQGIVASREIKVVPGDLAQLFVDPNPVTIKSGHSQEFQVTGTDVANNQVQVPELSWKVHGDIGSFKQPGQFFATYQGSGKIITGIDGIRAESYVTVIPGAPDPDNTRLRAEPPTVEADGKKLAKIIVEARDEYNNPVPDFQAKLVSSRQSDDLEQPGETNAQGLADGSVASDTPGTTTITALIGQEAVRDTVSIDFR